MIMKFGIKDKTFNGDIRVIYNALVNGEKFSFSKYADGEFAILINKKITNCDNWTFDPDLHQKHRGELVNSFKYSEDGYYVGISCPCCVGETDTKWMRDNVGVKPENLTWANIFVNGNYNFFKEYFIPEFKNHKVIIVANKNANISNLPFIVEEHIKISGTAWRDNFDLVNELPNKDYNDKLFLFCAGPLGNMLAARMWEKNKNNTYIDIGSTLNTYLVGANRGYLKGHNTINKTCIW
jgi:hypothetical protein